MACVTEILIDLEEAQVSSHSAILHTKVHMKQFSLSHFIT